MNHTGNHFTRILAIDLCNRGVGFVVLEGPHRLLDWGVKLVRPGDKPDDPELTHVRMLTRLYAPHAIVAEDMDAPGCRRRGRAVRLTRAVCKLAKTFDLNVHTVSATAVKTAFAQDGANTKAQIAAAVALRFPALMRHLPPLRKPWMSEDYRFGIFDAAAFLITHLGGGNLNDFPFDS